MNPKIEEITILKPLTTFPQKLPNYPNFIYKENVYFM